MYLMRHTIAGITFITESDIELTTLENNWFHRFTSEKNVSDIYHQIHRIEIKDLVLPPLSIEEQDCILQCNIQSQLGPGSFILPPFIREKDKIVEDGFCDFQSVQNPLDVPLLRAPIVRERLKSCLEHPDKIGLTLHTFSVAIYDYHLNRIDLFYRSDRQWIFSDVLLENGFRRMFSSFLPSFSAVMLHSSGIIRKGRAALFFASDEGGKSTVLTNLKDGIPLCDDRNIVRRDGDAFMAHSTPWGQINHGRQQARLGGLFLIEKSHDFELAPLRPRDALEFLWNEHIQFWNLLPKDLRMNAFEILADVCHKTPCYRMRFPKHYVDWNAIDEAMAD